MIELRDVKFGYGGELAAVDGVNLKIEDGEFVAIIGSNGAGKSTVSRLIRGLLKPEAGSVLVDGGDTRQMRASALAGKMGFLFQNPDRQICKSTVMEELLFTLSCAKVDKGERAALAEEMIHKFGIPANADPTALSRGERQRVALMSTLVSRPAILILDEPTTGLDFRECALIMDAIAEKNRAGATVVMVSHDMEVVLDYAKRAVVMDRGKIVRDGTPGEAFYAGANCAARILPPQIIELSLALNRAYGDVTTVEEMADAIEARAGREMA
jgi:energy-coupling factor transport system ATP-binding protein